MARYTSLAMAKAVCWRCIAIRDTRSAVGFQFSVFSKNAVFLFLRHQIKQGTLTFDINRTHISRLHDEQALLAY